MLWFGCGLVVFVVCWVVNLGQWMDGWMGRWVDGWKNCLNRPVGLVLLCVLAGGWLVVGLCYVG